LLLAVVGPEAALASKLVAVAVRVDTGILLSWLGPIHSQSLSELAELLGLGLPRDHQVVIAFLALLLRLVAVAVVL
jgi:hypothetical protein